MNRYNLNQESIRAALLKEADAYNPPDDFKQKIDARIFEQENMEVVIMKKYRIKKFAAAAALACAMTGTVCMAAGKISSYYSTTSEFTEKTDFADISGLEKKAGVKTGAQKTLANGFVFADANIRNVSAEDSAGNVEKSFQEVVIHYEKEDKSVNYVVGRTSDMEEDDAYTQMITSNGVDYYFIRADYLFVPDESDITKEDRAKQAAGELFISTGTDEREEQVVESLSWSVDGQRYLLSGEDLDMGAEGLLAMAEQMEY